MGHDVISLTLKVRISLSRNEALIEEKHQEENIGYWDWVKNGH